MKKRRKIIKKKTIRKAKIKIFTIGYSTRNLKEFIEILKKYKIEHLIDIRTIPYSYYMPEYNKEIFKKNLKKHKIKYTHMKGLGGLRHPKKNSVNIGWKNAGFRGYADYMQTSLFKKNLDRLIQYGSRKTLVIMCAEAVPWRCHRSLIGDYLVINKIKVVDIFSLNTKKIHLLTPWAKVYKKELFYPLEEDKNIVKKS